ncbi:MAG: leucyl/phenylalanyl-tRNA--protein transferase [Deltaproteobacteria bacterium]|nr:leucyl/phenylalanyl-tRNA--protein transferase [Deltaproteobacteria bacterium]
MVIQAFPPVELADLNGFLALGGDLEVDSLLLAYKSGIFPWPSDPGHLAWFAPPKRTVLFLKDAHISKSLQKARKRREYSYQCNTNFAEILAECAKLKNRGNQEGTWITPQMQRAYLNLHHAGYCHCFGCYHNHNLIGGLYGVSIGKMFAGESMFYRKTNASKLTLCFLIDFLKEQGVDWIDCQVMTPLLKSFGAVQIEREKFMHLLTVAINQTPINFPVHEKHG